MAAKTGRLMHISASFCMRSVHASIYIHRQGGVCGHGRASMRMKSFFRIGPFETLLWPIFLRQCVGGTGFISVVPAVGRRTMAIDITEDLIERLIKNGREAYTVGMAVS